MQQVDELNRRIAKLEGDLSVGFIDDSSKSLFINTTKEGSLGPALNADARRSALSRKTMQGRHGRSALDDDASSGDLKLMLSFKNEMRQKISELEEKYVSRDQVAEAIDKLGEEIAFDINQLEQQIGDGKKAPPGQEAKGSKRFDEMEPPMLTKLVSQAVGKRSDENVKLAIRQTTQDMRYQLKKSKTEMKDLKDSFDAIRKRLKDQNRLFEKMSHNNQRRHTSRSISKKRVDDLVTKKHFTTFLDLLTETFDISFALHEDAFQRDAYLTQSQLDSMYNATGTCIVVRGDVHDRLKLFQRAVLERHSTNYEEVARSVANQRKRDGHNDYMPDGIGGGGLAGSYDQQGGAHRSGVLAFKRHDMYPFHADENFDFFRHRGKRRAESTDGTAGQLYAWQLENTTKNDSNLAGTVGSTKKAQRRNNDSKTMTMTEQKMLVS